MSQYSRIRPTHTYATLVISEAAHAEIKAKLLAAGYGHVVIECGPGACRLDMHGIALSNEKPDQST